MNCHNNICRLIRSAPSHARELGSLVVSLSIVATLVAGSGSAGTVSIASAAPAGIDIVPAIDVPAPSWFTSEDGKVRSGGIATRIELDETSLNLGMSAWYRLAYVAGGTRLRVFEHYAITTGDPDPDIVKSEKAAWQVANKVIGAGNGSPESAELPLWARFHTGTDTGFSAGLMFTLAYIDLLTPGALVGDLRVVGTGGIGFDGVVFPVTNIEVKVAAALLTQPDVVFTTRPSKLVAQTTIVEAQHTRFPDAGYTVGEWLNLSGYENAGRLAASHAGTVAFVVVHDLRQALAWLCGRTDNATTCDVALRAASVPIGA